jgi:hypothetical protein
MPVSDVGIAYRYAERTVVFNPLQQLSREVDDTAMLAGSEAFTQTLSFYNSVKQAARDNQPGAQALFDELKKRFAVGRPGKKDEG